MKKLFFFMLLCLPSIAMAETDPKYLAGAVALNDDGKVSFKTEMQVSALTKEQLYNTLLEWADNRFKTDDTFNARILYSDENDGLIVTNGEEYLVFTSSALALDRSRIYYKLFINCEEGKCYIEMTRITYLYNEARDGGEKYIAEDWITDEACLNKAKTKLYPISGKFRRKTIDLKDELFKSIQDALGNKVLANSQTSTPKPEAETPVKPVVSNTSKVVITAPETTATTNPVIVTETAVPAATTVVAETTTPVTAAAVTETTVPATTAVVAETAAPVVSPVVAETVDQTKTAETKAVAQTEKVEKVSEIVAEQAAAVPVESAAAPVVEQVQAVAAPVVVADATTEQSQSMDEQINAATRVTITAGNDEEFEIGKECWGGFGQLFGKDVTFCFIDTQKTMGNMLLSQSQSYTISFYQNGSSKPSLAVKCNKLTQQTLSGEEAKKMNPNNDEGKSYNMYVGEIVK